MEAWTPYVSEHLDSLCIYVFFNLIVRRLILNILRIMLLISVLYLLFLLQSYHNDYY